MRGGRGEKTIFIEYKFAMFLIDIDVFTNPILAGSRRKINVMKTDISKKQSVQVSNFFFLIHKLFSRIINFKSNCLKDIGKTWAYVYNRQNRRVDSK